LKNTQNITASNRNSVAGMRTTATLFIALFYKD